MPALLLCLIVLLAYLLGSIPFGYLLVRIFRSEDIRRSGSGNIGATNVVRSGARGLGAATFLFDAAKGFVAVELARALMAASSSPNLPLAQLSRSGSLSMGNAESLPLATALAACFAVLGHIYPVWLRFKGGKGVATAFGVLLQLAPLAALVGFFVFVVVVLLSRYVSLASMLGAVAIPVAALSSPANLSLVWSPGGGASYGVLNAPRSPWTLAALILIPAIVIAKHHANIGRLFSGTEYRFGTRKESA